MASEAPLIQDTDEAVPSAGATAEGPGSCLKEAAARCQRPRVAAAVAVLLGIAISCAVCFAISAVSVRIQLADIQRVVEQQVCYGWRVEVFQGRMFVDSQLQFFERGPITREPILRPPAECEVAIQDGVRLLGSNLCCTDPWWC